MKKHIAELADKRYQDLVGDKRLDFVMMFIPNEGAYMAMMKLQPDIWQEAYEKRVLLTSPTHLIAALRMLDDLFQQRMEPVLILSAVSGAFVDCYRGKLAVRAGKSSQQAAADFGYFGGRAYYFGKACTKARGMSDGYLNACMEVLFRTNRLMNSSKTDSRLLLERAFTEISALKGARV